MQMNKTGSQKQPSLIKNNTTETLKELGSSMVKNTAASIKDLGDGMFNQLLGKYPSTEDYRNDEFYQSPNEKAKPAKRTEQNVFNYREYYEGNVVRREIKQLTEQIRKEIECLKRADKSFLADIKDIQRLSLESIPEKPGIYHVRFLEIVLSILRALRAKIGESKTWLQALVSKKKKRGSLFASLSKKKGTQYSLSQELQTARSVQ